MHFVGEWVHERSENYEHVRCANTTVHDMNRPDGASQTSQLFLKNLLRFVLLLHAFNKKYRFSVAQNYTRNIISLQSNPNGLFKTFAFFSLEFSVLREVMQKIAIKNSWKTEWKYISVIHCKTFYLLFGWQQTTMMTHFNRFSLYCPQSTKISSNDSEFAADSIVHSWNVSHWIRFYFYFSVFSKFENEMQKHEIFGELL